MIAVLPLSTITAAADPSRFGFFEIGEVLAREGPDRVLLR
jgi:hypothetical protein